MSISDPFPRTLFPTPPPQTEAEVRTECRTYLIEIGLHPFRVRQIGFARRPVRMETDGLADLFGILPDGRWWACEVKKPGARPRPNEARQNATLEYLRVCGAVVWTVRSALELKAAVAAAGIVVPAVCAAARPVSKK